MDIYKLIEDFERLVYVIEQKVVVIDNNINQGLEEMSELITQIQKIMPDWFFFIEQTEIGSKEMVMNVLEDIMEAVRMSDGVALTDALIYGLESLLVEYCEVIKEALNEE